MTEASRTSGAPAGGGFRTTRWSVVLRAADRATPRSRESLARLCETYWQPVYSYIKRQGENAEDARDLTQEFFATFLEKHYVASADPARGRFRSFLLASVQHFLCNEWDRRRAKKRGGGMYPVSLDAATSDGSPPPEPAVRVTPEEIFDRRWAVAIIARVLERLRFEQDHQGKRETFDLLLPLMCDVSSESYAPVAAALATTPGALRVAVHRLRRRFRALLLQEIADTVADPRDIDDEVKYLLRVVQGPVREHV